VALPLALATGCADTPSLEVDEARKAEITQEVNQTVLAFVDALNAHDADAILAFYRLDEDLARVACTTIHGGAQVVEARIRSSATQNKERTFEMVPLHVRVLGPTSAVVSVLGRTSTTNGLAWTLGMELDRQGNWRIVHEHQSWPGCEAPSNAHQSATIPDSIIREMEDPGLQ